MDMRAGATVACAAVMQSRGVICRERLDKQLHAVQVQSLSKGGSTDEPKQKQGHWEGNMTW